MPTTRLALAIFCAGCAPSLLAACGGGGGDNEAAPVSDAGPPAVHFAYGDQYPDPQILLEGVLTPSNDAFPMTWITARVIARMDYGTGMIESLEGLTATLRVISVADDSVIAEATTPMTAILEETSSLHIAWSDVSFEICADARTNEGASLRAHLTAIRDGVLFVEADSGPQRISCEGDPDCSAMCGP